MNLKDWVRQERKQRRLVTLEQVASDVGIAPTNLSRACNGKSVPHLRVVQRIHNLTGGRVSLFDWPGTGLSEKSDGGA